VLVGVRELGEWLALGPLCQRVFYTRVSAIRRIRKLPVSAVALQSNGYSPFPALAVTCAAAPN
jgi:hypothetical protein